VIEIGRVEHVRGVERRVPFLPQPEIQRLDDARAQRCCLHHAAVEEDVRRAGDPARTATDVTGHRSAGCLAREEPSEVTGHRGIRGVG